MSGNRCPHIPARCKYLQQLCKCFTSRLATLCVRGEEKLLFLLHCNFIFFPPSETTKRFLLLHHASSRFRSKFTRLLARRCTLGRHKAWLINQFGCDAEVHFPLRRRTCHRDRPTTKKLSPQKNKPPKTRLSVYTAY